MWLTAKILSTAILGGVFGGLTGLMSLALAQCVTSGAGGVVNAGFNWRPKSNVSFFASAEAMATNDKAYSVVGKGGVRVGF